MFHILNKNLNFQLIFITILTGWAGWTIFTQMTFLPSEGSMFLFQLLSNLWVKAPVLIRILVLIMVITMTIGITTNFEKNHFHENRTFMPGLFLLLLLNCGKFLHSLTPGLLTVFILSLLIVLYSPNDQSSRIKERIFTVGLLISIATFFDISAFGLAIFFILMIAINNITSFKDIMILFLGLLFPYIYAFSIAFISNSLPQLLHSWQNMHVFEPIKQFTHLRIIDYATMFWFVIVVISLMIRDKNLLDNKLIVIRQAFNNVNMLLFSMLLFLWLSMFPLPTALIYFLLPVSTYMAISITHKKYRYLFDFLIVSLCILLCL